MCIPKSLAINLVFIMLIIIAYLYLEDKTDLFQLNSKRNKAVIDHQKYKVQNLFNSLNISERKINSQNSVDNIIDDIFEILNRNHVFKNFIKITNIHNSEYF
jgi:hypothetical protein